MARSVAAIRAMRQLGADFSAPTYAQQLLDAHTFLSVQYGTFRLGDRGSDTFSEEALARVPARVGLEQIAYWARQGIRAAVSTGVASITSALPGDGREIAQRLDEVRQLWKELEASGDTPSDADTAALWDALAELAAWCDTYAKGGAKKPEQLTLTATGTYPTGVPPFASPKPPPSRTPGTPGKSGWVILLLALYLATRSR